MAYLEIHKLNIQKCILWTKGYSWFCLDELQCEFMFYCFSLVLISHTVTSTTLPCLNTSQCHSPIGRTRPGESCLHRCQKCDSMWFRKMSNTWGNLLSTYLLEYQPHAKRQNQIKPGTNLHETYNKLWNLNAGWILIALASPGHLFKGLYNLKYFLICREGMDCSLKYCTLV